MKDSQKLLAIGVALFALDQFSKWVIRNSMDVTQSIPIINKIFHITYIQNTGAVFGMLKGFGWAIVWLTIMALGIIVFYWDKFPNKFNSRLFLVFIVVGLVGNLIDRIVFGYVIDFLDFRIWPVFNLADSLVSIGVIGLIVGNIKKK